MQEAFIIGKIWSKASEEEAVSVNQARVLIIQDISASCRISMNVALPVLSCLDNEVNILPTALLSTHTTAGFDQYTYLDLTEESEKILAHWDKLGILFDGILVGYIGSVKQIKRIEAIVDRFLKKGGHFILDPAMAESGKLYDGFGQGYVKEMRLLAKRASVLLPNQTEASLLVGSQDLVQEPVDLENLVFQVAQISQETAILTGVHSKDGQEIGAYSCNGQAQQVQREFAAYYPGHYEGSGDLFASVVTGLILQGKSIHQAMTIAVGYVSRCIGRTSHLSEDKRRYGIQFESDLAYLMNQL